MGNLISNDVVDGCQEVSVEESDENGEEKTAAK